MPLLVQSAISVSYSDKPGGFESLREVSEDANALDLVALELVDGSDRESLVRGDLTSTSACAPAIDESTRSGPTASKRTRVFEWSRGAASLTSAKKRQIPPGGIEPMLGPSRKRFVWAQSR
jgi:hypothetical protein